MKVVNKKLACPKHGETIEMISSNVKDHEGKWCMLCVLEKLDELGVNRLEEIKDKKSK